MMIRAATLFCGLIPFLATAQSADWTQVIWREPQVRYLLADMTLGGTISLYRGYATTEGDPDSREAIRLWDSGARMVNTNEFERRWVTNQFGKDGHVMRVVLRGSSRTITGNEVLLTSDLPFQDAAMRLALLELSLGIPPSEVEALKQDVNTDEAIRRFKAGDRALNTNLFELRRTVTGRRAIYRDSDRPADGSRVRLLSDLAYSEVNVRYFLADMHLGGSREFYHRTAEIAHEMGCQEAVARFDAGVKITNLGEFERKAVDGKVLVTRKGTNERISGWFVRLSTDLQP
jgi:hypothetical protein